MENKAQYFEVKDNRRIDFSIYFHQHKQALLGFALKLTSDINQAEDLVQDTALRSFKSFHTFRENSNFRNWTFSILKNLFIYGYRGKMKKGIQDLHVEEIRFEQESDFHVANEAISNLAQENLLNCLYDLSGKVRKPLLMFTHGYKYEEIAIELEIPVGTVKSRINYSRKTLKHVISLQEKQAA